MTCISNSLRTSFKWVTCKLYSTLKTKVLAIDVEISEMKQQCSFCPFLGNFKPIEACKPSLNHLNHLKHHHNQPTLPPTLRGLSKHRVFHLCTSAGAAGSSLCAVMIRYRKGAWETLFYWWGGINRHLMASSATWVRFG